MERNSGLLRHLYSVPVLVALLYIVFMTPLMGRKHGYTVDATPSFQLTKTIAVSGEWFPQNLRIKQGYIYSIVYMPFYFLGDTIASFFPRAEAAWIQRKCMCWMNTVLTGCTLAVLSLLLRRLNFSRRTQTVIPLAYGLSTLAFNYARYDYNKCLAALLLVTALYAVTAFWKEKLSRYAVLCGLAASALLAVRLELAVIVPVLLWGILYPPGATAERIRRALYFCVPCLLGIGWVLLYNRLYWSGGVSGGYEGGFQANPFPAILGFLFSPGKNIWFFNPVLILLPLTLRAFYQTNKNAFILWASASLLVFAPYCFWWNWWGGWGWGPRHLVPLLPVLMIPLATIVQEKNRFNHILFGLLIAAGFFVQFLGSAIDFNDVILALTRSEILEADLIWNPIWNAIIQHALFLGHRPVPLWDIGWIGLKNSLSFPAFSGMLLLWTGMLAGLGYALFRRVRE